MLQIKINNHLKSAIESSVSHMLKDCVRVKLNLDISFCLIIILIIISLSLSIYYSF